MTILTQHSLLKYLCATLYNNTSFISAFSLVIVLGQHYDKKMIV